MSLYRVVTIGITNAGKSSLLSALADIENLFLAKDVPNTTRKIQVEKVFGLELVDTPGLDAGDQEFKLAISQIPIANTILWCHSLRRGELHEKEIEVLKSYGKAYLRRTCFVLTHADNLANSEILKRISEKIAEQLKNIFNLNFKPIGKPDISGSNPRPFDVVGIKQYWFARKENNEKMLKKSGIPRLRDFLISMAYKNEESFRDFLTSLVYKNEEENEIRGNIYLLIENDER